MKSKTTGPQRSTKPGGIVEITARGDYHDLIELKAALITRGFYLSTLFEPTTINKKRKTDPVFELKFDAGVGIYHDGGM